jgi:hypothetical protein
MSQQLLGHLLNDLALNLKQTKTLEAGKNW